MTISKYLPITAIAFALIIPRGEAKETGDTSSDHNNKGVELAQQHQYEAAINEFNLALKANPKNAKAYVNRGSIFRAMHAQAHGWREALANSARCLVFSSAWAMPAFVVIPLLSCCFRAGR